MSPSTKQDFKIRLALPTDAPQMLAIYTPFIQQTVVSFETEVPSVEEFWGRVETVLEEAPWLVCTHQDRVVGYAYAGKHRSRIAYRYTRELSAYVHEDFRKKGIASALYTALFEILKLQGFANTIIGITLPNDASLRFHEKFGYQLVGIYHNIGFKNGAYHDVGWWELSIREEPPGDILGMGQLTKENFEVAFNHGLSLIH